jgi:hypothetical protein
MNRPALPIPCCQIVGRPFFFIRCDLSFRLQGKSSSGDRSAFDVVQGVGFAILKTVSDTSATASVEVRIFRSCLYPQPSQNLSPYAAFIQFRTSVPHGRGVFVTHCDVAKCLSM